MMKERHKIAQLLEKIEVYFEDILIAIFSIFVIIVLIGVVYILANSEVFVTNILKIETPKAAFPLILMLTGYILLPWILILGIMIISRDLWLIRRSLEMGRKKAKKS